MIFNPVSQVLLFSSQAKGTSDDEALFRFGFLADYPLLDLYWSLEQGQDASQCTVKIPGDDSDMVDALLSLKLYNPQPPQPTSSSSSSSGIGNSGNAADKLAHEQKIIAECIRQGVTSTEQIAYILASAEHESDYFKTQVEYASGAQYEGRSDLGNTQAGDGVRFKGRGYVQLTGRANYKKYSDKLGKDLIGNPDIVSSDQDVSRYILVDGMKTGAFTGVGLDGYIGNGRKDYVGARAIVNGDDVAGKIAGQAETYEQRLKSGDLKRYLTNTPPASPTTAPTSPIKPSEKVPTTITTQEPPKTEAGGMLLIRVGEFGGLLYEYVYLLSDVQFSVATGKSAQVELRGVSPLWAINQYRQTDAKGGLTLKMLATQITKDAGLSLEFEGEGTFLVHVENPGLTPYQLLLRESRRAGYVMYSEGTRLVMHPIKPTKSEDGSESILLPLTDIISFSTSSKPGGQTPGSGSGVKGAWGKQPTIKQDASMGLTSQVAPTKAATSSVVNSPKSGMDLDKDAKTTGLVGTGSKVITTQSAQAETARVKDYPTSVNLLGSIGYLGIVPCNLVKIPTLTQYSPLLSETEFWVSAVHFTLGQAGLGVGLDLYKPGASVPISQAMSGQSGTGAASITPTVGGWVHPYPGSQITAPWGEQRGSRRHGGQDWAGGNGRILSAQSGTVTDIQTGCRVGDSSCGGGYGNLVDIVSDVGGKKYLHRYAHLTSVSVSTGQQVQAGSQIGVEGNTGASFGDHLHFEIRDPNQLYGFGGSLNPADFGIK